MKKLLALGAIGCAALMALAGCGGGGNNNRPSGSVEELKSNYGFQWEDPSKPILNAEGSKDISFNVYSSKNSAALDYNEMDIMQTLYNETGVFVNWENVSEAVYGDNKLLKLGRHDGIDAIYHAGLTGSDLVTYGARRHALLAIDEYLDYMPNFKKILKDRNDIKKQITCAEDGHIYALPRIEEMGLLQNPNLLFLNKAWTEAAIDAKAVTGVTKDQVVDGLSLTATQMHDLLAYFKAHDMNGNGSLDERPLTFVNNNWQGNICDLYGMFGLNDNPDHRVIIDGKVVYTVLDDRFKEATQYLHNWVEDKLIDPVCFEQTQNDFLANGKGSEEKYGAFYWWESDTVVDDPTHYICCAPLTGPNGDQTVCVSNNPEVSTGELIFFADTPNVEVLLAYFDRYYAPEISAQINYGPIGIAFTEEDGKLVAKEPPKGTTTDELRLKNAPLGICYLAEGVWGKTVEMEPRAKLRLERLGKYATPYYDHDKVKPIPNLQFTRAELDTLSKYEANINSYLRRNILDWLRKGLSDNAWESHKKTAASNSVGINAVLQVYQAAYDRYLAEN